MSGRGGRGGGAGGGFNRAPLVGLASEVVGVTLFPVDAQASTFPDIPIEKQRDITSQERADARRADGLIKAMKRSAFYLVPPAPESDIQRYSDKYKVIGESRLPLSSITTDLSFFPEELHQVHNPKLRQTAKKARLEASDVVSELDALVKEAEEGTGKAAGERVEGKEDGEGGEEEDQADDFDDEDDENDYVEEYFDNGEGDGDDGDDGGDGRDDY